MFDQKSNQRYRRYFEHNLSSIQQQPSTTSSKSVCQAKHLKKVYDAKCAKKF